MKYIYKLKNWIFKQYKLYFLSKFSYNLVNELPDKLPENKILIISEGYVPDSLVFKCPCGCNSSIYLNLLFDAKPCWKYFITNKRMITVTPSIRRKIGCKSHFYIRDGRINWVKD